MELIFELSKEKRKGLKLPSLDVPKTSLPDESFLRRRPAQLPEVGELELVRHYTNLSKRNYSLDSHFYPLGSCTMKYNPKILELVSELEGFSNLAPQLALSDAGSQYSQGAFFVLNKLSALLAEITGMSKVSLSPLAGAQGELAGMLIVKAYHRKKKNKKRYVIVPDTSHGTNPASVSMVGYEVVSVSAGANGQMDIGEFREKLNDQTAAIIMTCPNTLGIFNTQVKEICQLAHSKDALCYYDGANLNAILGKVKPGELGFDIAHLNLHKTFATPHGGGGPGAGPVGVKEKLVSFLPGQNDSDSIGRLAPFFGNFSVLLKALAYILILGKEGLERVSDYSVLNANYIFESLKNYYEVPFKRRCMHECVLSAKRQKEKGVSALDIAKFIIQNRMHPPTIYFPLIVKEALMIEPTETENKAVIDQFIQVMKKAAKLSDESQPVLKQAPRGYFFSDFYSRFDETKAARENKLIYKEKNQDQHKAK